MRLSIFCLLCLGLSVLASAQIAPPYLTVTTPTGGERGQKVTLTVEGYNLTDATAVLWSKPGISATITANVETARETPRPSTDPTKRYQGDRGTRNRVTIETTIAPDAEIGIYRFRLKTPLGTTNLHTLYVGALHETIEAEMNDTPQAAQNLTLPTTVVGEMQTRGDRDYFKFMALAGQQLVFEVVASAFGAKFDGVLALFDVNGKQLATNNDFDFRRDPMLAYTFALAGEYVVRLTDLEQQGISPNNEYGYRLNIGELPFVTGVFPLGLQQGTTAKVAVTGFHLGMTETSVTAPAQAVWNEAVPLKLVTAKGQMFNTPRLAIGQPPEVLESNAVKTLAAPQVVTAPITINGRLHNASANTEEDFYRFTARKGQTLMLEIGAQRFGSPLDTVIEVYDSAGKLVPRALLRSLNATEQTLNDRDSSGRGLRVLNWSELAVNDYILIGNEVLQIDVLPKGPDEDTFFKSFNGQRLGYFDTTPEAHAIFTPMYKVSVHPPNAKLPPNGLPQITLYYRNDDGGPMYGKDSRLTFTAPADGAYTVRVRDVRGLQGERFSYRLTIREPQPDFVLSLDPENANVPRGSGLMLTARAFRTDGWTGDIEVKLMDLPPGFTATTGVIRGDDFSTQILLSASPEADAKLTFPLKLRGTALIQGKRLVRELDTRERIAVATAVAAPEVLVWTEQEKVTLEPGGNAWVTIKIKREGEFKGRVLFDVRNLPHGVIVKDVGLNGVMIPEDETTQRFELAAASWVKPMELPFFVVARVETMSPQRLESPARPLALVIQAKTMAEQPAGPR